MSLLNDAIEAAADLHRGQVDKGGEPYILHPLRVMLAMKTEMERVLAVLHDTVEDQGWSKLHRSLLVVPGWLEDGLDAISRREGETYEAFIERCAKNDLARRVKLADLADNLDVSRLPDFTDADRERCAKYSRAQMYLSGIRVRPSSDREAAK